MATLGWKLGDYKAEYSLSLPRLSDEECELVEACAKRIAGSDRAGAGGEKPAMDEAKGAVLAECEEQGLEIDEEQEDYLASAVYLKTYGRGFLEELLTDATLEEIAVIGIGKPVYVYVRGDGWKKTNVAVDSQDYFVALVNRLGRGLGRRLTAQQPRLNAVLEDGSRLHASMPPVSECELTIRKFSREPISALELLSRGTYDEKMLAWLSLAFQADLPILFCGNTASGKTTSLNAMLCFVPSSERLLLIEETPEISVPHTHQLRLMPFEEGKIGMVELVRDSLRMRPDRVVVGEVRGAEEARAFAESALSGQAKGCYATFHAQSSRDAMLRMRMMGCLEADLEGIGVFIVQRRVSTYDSGKRKVGEARRVTEIAVANPAEPLRPIVVYDGKRFLSASLPLLAAKIAQGTEMSEKKVAAEAARREKFLRNARKRRVRGFVAAYEAMQQSFFGGAR